MSGQAAPTSAGMGRSRRSTVLLVWLPIVLLLLALVASGELARVGRIIFEARIGSVVAMLLVGLLLPVVHARRWQAMLRAVGEDVPLLPAVEMTVTASMVNYALPGYVGSPTKGALARQLHGIGFGRSIPTLAAEQGLDALALLVGALVGVALGGRSSVGWLGGLLDRSLALTIFVLALVVVAVIGVATLAARRYARRFLSALSESARMLAADRRQRLPILLLTIVYWLLGVLAVWLAVDAVGISLSAASLLLLSNVPLLLGLISPLPGGLGLREAAMAGIAGAVGISIAGVVAAAVLQRVVLVIALPLMLGLCRLGRRSLSWR